MNMCCPVLVPQITAEYGRYGRETNGQMLSVDSEICLPTRGGVAAGVGDGEGVGQAVARLQTVHYRRRAADREWRRKHLGHGHGHGDCDSDCDRDCHYHHHRH